MPFFASQNTKIPQKPENATAVIVLADGSLFWGKGFGAAAKSMGEICFNTSMTGYQEILSDPSYAGQIINFTFPHIGNVGANDQDIETINVAARGLMMREEPTTPSNWRSNITFQEWLVRHNIPAIAGIDTRAMTRHIRDNGAQTGVLVHAPDGKFDIPALLAEAREWGGLNGLDLAKTVTRSQTEFWDEGLWQLDGSYSKITNAPYTVVAVDYGAKRNILRCLAQVGCRVIVVPAATGFDEIMSHKPDGVFLSNGPGDPAATGIYAVPTIKKLVEANIPLFGICLGHQMLALALGGKTTKMRLGHRGANHPVKDLQTGRVEITSQNHGFHVLPETLPADVEVTHISLFDNTNEGLRHKTRPVFSVQYHPEASPGPMDSHYLFHRFIEMIAASKGKAAA